MRSLYDRLMYRMEGHGTYEKDGEVHTKYLKTRRFPHLTRIRVFIALLVVFISFLAFILIWVSLEKATTPSTESGASTP